MPSDSGGGERFGPELELLAAFIDGTLDDDQRGRLLERIADDDDFYTIFVGAIDFLRSQAEPEPELD